MSMEHAQVAGAAAEWLARGRRHQWQGRAVDAMLCFRRAAREAAQAMEPRFYLGEVLWTLGGLQEAIASWREAAALAPEHPAARMALAEALLFTGDAAGARAEAAQRLHAHPRDARARAVVALADLVMETQESADVLVASLEHMPALLGVPAISGTLAQALDRTGATGRTRILAAIAALEPSRERVAAMPPALIAQVVEHAASTGSRRFAPWLDAALARSWEPFDHDAVRRIAVVAADLPAGDRLAQHFAMLCERAGRAVPPRAWPHRARGAALRVLVIAGPDARARAAQATLSALPATRFDVVVAALGAEADQVGASIVLSPLPGAEDAKRVAALDPDVIVDLSGYGARAGALLAQRPARLQLTLADLPLPHRAPLVDDAAATTDALIGTLASLQAALPPPTAGVPDAAGLASLWNTAVERHQRGDSAGARNGYDAVLAAQCGAHALSHFLRGRLLADEGDKAAAQQAYAAALKLSPGFADARVAAIRAAIDAGDATAAQALAAEGLARDTDPPVALLRACGSARLTAGDGAGAAALMEAALARDPVDAETHYNHGVALQMQRRLADAARAYQRALTFRPDFAAADFNLGVIFGDQGNRDAAIQAFSKVLERNPAHAMAYRNLGDALFAAGRFDEWRANFARFEAHCPAALPLAVHALEVCQWNGDFARVERYLDGLRNERFHAADARQLADALEELLYLLLFFDIEPELYARVAQTYDQVSLGVHGPPRAAPVARRPGRIRIGYLSADLRNHVMGKMIFEAVSRHDRARFDVRFYSLSRARDAWTERFERAGDALTVVAGMPEREAAARISEDDLDVLVDLSTHTRGARPGIVAAKPARVAITHVASAGILGLSCVDYRLTDAYCDVAPEAAPPSEALLPMAGCVYPYRHVEPAATTPAREALGLPRDAIVVGAFVTGLKLSRRCLSLWREVLERLPQARIAFSPLHPAQAPLYVRLAQAGGIAAERIVFVPQGKDDAVNQARYRRVDFVLDPMPYGGVNGTLEALDMGVPVVTLVGRRHGERTSYSILTNLGVTATIADSGKQYVDIAVRLATDAEFARGVRAAIRAGLRASPLVDMTAHARHLEAAYCAALRERVRDAPIS